jgi:hypothetical protein
MAFNLTGFGLAGRFTGSSAGIVAGGFKDFGILGISEAGFGVKGESLSSYGGYFINSEKSKPDLVVGGNLTNASGIIASDPDFSASGLLLRSNNSLLVQLDHDNNSDGFFALHNGAGSAVMSVGEAGDMALIGNSTLTKPHLLLTETEAGDYARLRLKSTSTTDFWDIAGGSFLNSQLNFYHSNVGNILQLNSLGNPITTSTGAYLSPSGVWTNASAFSSARRVAKAVDPLNILSELNKLQIHYWKSDGPDQIKHIAPSAEDFYRAFGCGEDDQHLAASDMAAVALAAIQALEKENLELKKTVQSMSERFMKLELKLETLTNP